MQLAIEATERRIIELLSVPSMSMRSSQVASERARLATLQAMLAGAGVEVGCYSRRIPPQDELRPIPWAPDYAVTRHGVVFSSLRHGRRLTPNNRGYVRIIINGAPSNVKPEQLAGQVWGGEV